MGVRLLKRFCTDERGNLALMFAFAAIPFLLAAGLAVDYGRTVAAKHRLQVALDSAVLATGALRYADDEARKALGKAYFEANFDARAFGLVVPDELISIQDHVVTASETVEVKTWFMHLAGLLRAQPATSKTIEVGTHATALVPQVGKAEIALVLDYSGSMSGNLNGVQKYRTMRDAAKKLIARVSAASETPEAVQFSLVPFNYGVKANLMGKHLTGPQYNLLSGEVRTLSCVSGRKQNGTFDVEPGLGKRDRWQQNDLWIDVGHENRDRSHLCAGILPLRELTSDTSVLFSDLDTWRPRGATHISSGFQFGWHTISPNSVFEGGAPYSKVHHANPAERVYKAIVLLSDGRQTSPDYRWNGEGQDNPKASDPRWPLNNTNGERNLEVLCRNAQRVGIVVVTVAFDLDHLDTLKRLNTCASPKDPGAPFGDRFAYKADTIEELDSAFEEIGTILNDMVHLSK